MYMEWSGGPEYPKQCYYIIYIYIYSIINAF